MRRPFLQSSIQLNAKGGAKVSCHPRRSEAQSGELIDTSAPHHEVLDLRFACRG
jgi:hypothetical protein